jgi:hypothetical protein
MSDPVERHEQLERKILAIPEDAFLSLQRRVRVMLMAVVLAIAGGIVAVLIITSTTREAVQGEVVPILEGDIEALERENAKLEDISNQQTDAILLLIETLQANGITPPEIVIRPTPTTEEPDG